VNSGNRVANIVRNTGLPTCMATQSNVTDDTLDAPSEWLSQ